MKVYHHSHQSRFRLVFLILRDLLLSLIIIGLIMLIKDLWDYFSHKIFITDDGILMKSGILITENKEVPFNNINIITISQGIFGKIFNYGNFIVNTGGDKAEIVFKHLHNPKKFKDLVNDRLVLN